MPPFLSGRNTTLTERMDDPNCDKQELFNTYRQFSVINSLISRWKKIYRTDIRPACQDLSKPYSLLDIGFGGGDLPIKIAQWAKRDGISLEVTAIETDPRAMEFIQDRTIPNEVSFLQHSSGDLVKQNATFDFVISNHLIHHLTEQELHELLDQAEKLSTRKVLFNDIERSDAGYLLFNTLSRPVFRSSFITEDGLTSIKRSYTARELREAVPASWKVSRIFPWRLLLSYDHS